MENVSNSAPESKTSENMVWTVNEVANALGENYKTVAKILNTLASQEKISVTEKAVNNRVLKGYILSISDIQNIKENFQRGKHSVSKLVDTNIQMLTNALTTKENAQTEEKNTNDISVKFYEVSNRNIELTKEVEKLRTEIQTKTNTNVRLEADLTVAKSELKFITDKSASMESAYAEKKIEVEKLEKVIKNKDVAIILLSAVLLVIITVLTTFYLIRHF